MNDKIGTVYFVILVVALVVGYSCYKGKEKADERNKENLEYFDKELSNVIADICDAGHAYDLHKTIEQIDKYVHGRPISYMSNDSICNAAYRFTGRTPAVKPAANTSYKDDSLFIKFGILPSPSYYSKHVGSNCQRKNSILYCRRNSSSGSAIQDIVFDYNDHSMSLIGYENEKISNFISGTRCNIAEQRRFDGSIDAFCLSDNLVDITERTAYLYCETDSISVLKPGEKNGEKYSGKKNICLEAIKKKIGFVPKKPKELF